MTLKTTTLAKLLVGLSVAIFALSYQTSARAAEGASGFYLLGSKGSMAGILAPPGTYLSADSYVYSGNAAADISLPMVGGQLALGLDADVVVSVTTLLQSTPYTIFGGRLGFGAVVPIVGKDVSASAVLNLGGAPISAAASDDIFAFGDPLLTAILGWDRGNWHVTLNYLLNIPIGSYTEGALANAGFNRWGFDTTLAVTYLDPKTGFELTVAPGFTVNGKNLDTDYRTGTEFHLEFAVMQHVSPSFAVGLVGYNYQQVTRDSGTAPGPFKGRVMALGPGVNFNFKLGRLPVSGKAKFYHEFNVKSRMEGNAGYLQLAMPLSASSAPLK